MAEKLPEQPEVKAVDAIQAKVCMVCGDRALSCNFGAITCESCKAFFRRNATKEWNSKCDGNCLLTVETRSYCKKCRLLKCVEVGMKKCLILSDEQKKMRKQKILENKIKRIEQFTGDSSNPVEYTSVTPQGKLHILQVPFAMPDAKPQEEDRRVHSNVTLDDTGGLPPQRKRESMLYSSVVKNQTRITENRPLHNIPKYSDSFGDKVMITPLMMKPYSSSTTANSSTTTKINPPFQATAVSEKFSNHIPYVSGPRIPTTPTQLQEFSESKTILKTIMTKGKDNLPLDYIQIKSLDIGKSDKVDDYSPKSVKNISTDKKHDILDYSRSKVDKVSIESSKYPEDLQLLKSQGAILKKPNTKPKHDFPHVYVSSQYANQGESSGGNAEIDIDCVSPKLGPNTAKHQQVRVKDSSAHQNPGDLVADKAASSANIVCSGSVEGNGKPYNQVNKKQRTFHLKRQHHKQTGSEEDVSPSDSDTSEQPNSSSSSSTAQQGFPQSGVVSTTLKVLMDSDAFRAGLQNLPGPVVIPNYEDYFEDPVLKVDNWVFMKHIDQIKIATTTAFYIKKQQSKCPKDPSFVQIFNFSESAIRNLVTFAKHLEPFLGLSSDDQIILLKNSILEMMVLMSASNYDHKIKGWVITDGTQVRTVETTTVKASREGSILMGHYEMIILYVLSATRRDIGIIVMLTILTLFSTLGQRALCCFNNKAKVEEGYQIYTNILKTYTALKYPDVENMMESVLRAQDIVRDFSETYMQSIMKSPLHKINPLLLEIFDLPMP